MSRSLEGLDVAPSVLELIGNTPLVRLGNLEAAHGLTCPVVAKLETANPGGSVKDRPALTMIEAAERDGLLRPGGTIIEPTSGNTGVGLAVVAAQRGYRCVFVVTDKVAPEKVSLLRAYGADVVVCPVAVAPEDPESYYSTAERLLAETPGAFGPSQYHNPDNPRAHYETTGPEIWRQTNATVTHLVAGAGTGGTVSGAGRYLKEQNPGVRVIVADPDASVYAGGDGRPYLVEGIGEDFWPSTYDTEVVDEVLPVTDAQSFAMAREATRTEGLLIGGSGGTAVFGAIEVAKRLGPDDLVVVVVPDSGRGYLSRVFDDGWLLSMGFSLDAELPTDTAKRREGLTVGDVLGPEHKFVYARPGDTLGEAERLMQRLSLLDIPVAKGEMPVPAADLVGTISADLPGLPNEAGSPVPHRTDALVGDLVGDLMGPAPGIVGIHEKLAVVAWLCQQATTGQQVTTGQQATTGQQVTTGQQPGCPIHDDPPKRTFHRPFDGRFGQRPTTSVVVMEDGKPCATVSADWLVGEYYRCYPGTDGPYPPVARTLRWP